MGLRSFIMWFMPAGVKAFAEADSRKWIATCPHCGHQASIWDYGGIRYKAAGKPTTRLKCLGCQKFGWQPIRYREG